MVDLSQDQPLKQKPTPDAPASDQSPVTQPVAPSKQLDDISSPQITTEEKIATPEQEEIKKELSELGIPPEGGSKKTKVLLAALGVLLLLATLPAAVYLVKQRQEIRKEAEGGWDISCPTVKVFGDLKPGDEYFEEVYCLADCKDEQWYPDHHASDSCYCIIAGYPDKEFKASRNITRAEAVDFITRYHIHVRGDWEWQIPSQPSFSDVPYNTWYYPFIETAYANGLVTGYGGGLFGPNDPWLYGFHGVDKSEYNDFAQQEGTITRGNFIRGLYDYGIDNGELPLCLPPSPLTCIDLGGEPDPSGLSPGEEVALACTASSDSTIPIDHFEFRVSSDSGTPVELSNVVAITKTDGEYQGSTIYTIPDYGCYKVECRACTADGCTVWGQAR